MKPSSGRCRGRDGGAWRLQAPSDAAIGGAELGGEVLGGGG